MRWTVACCLFTLTALAVPRAHAFCVEQPSNNGTPFAKVSWALMPITFRVHDTGSGTMDKAAELAGVRAAFAEWAAAPCVKLSFTEGALIPSTEGVNLHHTAQEIRVYWARDTVEWDGQNVAPIAKTWFNFDVSGNLVSAAVLLNAINKQYSTAAGGEAEKYDVQSVMATEVGRLIGLAASLDSSAVMYPSFAMGNVDKRTLTADDLAAVHYLYPLDNSGDGGLCADGTPDPSCPPPGTTPQSDGGVGPTDDGGTTPTQHDGGTVSDGGTRGDGGGFACTANEQCESGICGSNGECVPRKSESGCGCRAAGAGGWFGGALGVLALALVLRRRR